MIKPKNFWLPELSLFGDLLKIERFFIITSKNFQKRISAKTSSVILKREF